MNREPANLDVRVAEGFGDEWKRFDQSCLSEDAHGQLFAAYFAGFPWAELPADAVGADFGCGSGRWALRVAPRVGKLYCIDASAPALEVSRNNLREMKNCEFILCSVGSMPIREGSLDFGYSLGVLHHIPDPFAGLANCVRTLKPRAPLLLYLYYAMENRPRWYRAIWAVTDCARRLVSRLPHPARYVTSQIVAAAVYWPLARGARLARSLGIDSSNFPLQFYADKPFYVMRTDALDRLGTRIEWRFSQTEMKELMEGAGLRDVTFNREPPFWCAVGYRKS